MSNNDNKTKYLAMVGDETLAEHDARYHHDGYKAGDKCKKREGMAASSPIKDAEAEKRHQEFVDKWKKYLAGISISQLSETLHKFDDDKHPVILDLIVKEIKRRERKGLEDYMTGLGEQA